MARPPLRRPNSSSHPLCGGCLTTVGCSASRRRPGILWMEGLAMKKSTRWFGWTVVLLALHLSEQLLFGIGELATLKRVPGVYYGWFAQPDYGTVVLVMVVGTLLNLLFLGMLRGGIWQRISASFFGLIGITEVHHLGGCRHSTAPRSRARPASVL